MKNRWIIGFLLLGLLFALEACNKEFLEERPMSWLSTADILSTEKGFENYMTSLHAAARNEMTARDQVKYYYIMSAGTDVASFGHVTNSINDYNQLLTPGVEQVRWLWEWAYGSMLLRANTIIS